MVHNYFLFVPSVRTHIKKETPKKSEENAELLQANQLTYFDFLSENTTKNQEFVRDSIIKFQQEVFKFHPHKEAFSSKKLAVFADGGGSIKNNVVVSEMICSFSSLFRSIKISFFISYHWKKSL
ncbi:hypothetical protein M0811_05498 [Anaeramoeba ignava]|uniref:Uncharacterized protein n=1 Tax=Anaeramoeba ignava TaxID=1746090 RepID=A0A9Q0LRS4_ANAIG|nr:hypothetical protein M0811_05498 [Anaeramoeba ignava]